VVVKLLFKVVNYQVDKLFKSSWKSFCLPVDSYPFTYKYRYSLLTDYYCFARV